MFLLSSGVIFVDPSDISMAVNPNFSASSKNSENLFFMYAISNRVPPGYGFISWDKYISTFFCMSSLSCRADVPHPNLAKSIYSPDTSIRSFKVLKPMPLSNIMVIPFLRGFSTRYGVIKLNAFINSPFNKLSLND